MCSQPIASRVTSVSMEAQPPPKRPQFTSSTMSSSWPRTQIQNLLPERQVRRGRLAAAQKMTSHSTRAVTTPLGVAETD